MPDSPRYRSGLTDSAWWDGFAFRPGDIVISTPARCGTTWLQMICALLIFQEPVPPAPLTVLSPWLDMCLRPKAEVWERLAAQRHRRFIKTHTPLDGLPAAGGVTYLTAARDPRDVAASLLHHVGNLDLDALGAGVRLRPPADRARWLRRWIDNDIAPVRALASLRGLAWHLEGAWARRDRPDSVLVHFADLLADPGGQMRRLADRLDVRIPARRRDGLVQAASFDAMRARSALLAPHEERRLFRDDARFFHRGTSGQWRDLFGVDDLARYRARVGALARPELVEWLHRSG